MFFLIATQSRAAASKRYPDSLAKKPEDEAALEKAAPKELASWRQEMAKHHTLPSIEEKLKNRGNLEKSYAAIVAAKRRHSGAVSHVPASA